MIPTVHFLSLSVLLFGIGTIGVLTRRNSLIVLMSIEIMLNASNLAFVAFARHHGQLDGDVIAFFVMALAAAEVAIGLAILMVIFRRMKTTDLASLHLLKG